MIMTRRTIVVSFCVLLGGCGFFGGKSKNQYFSLQSVPAAAAPAAATAFAGAPLGIDGVELPPGFDRQSIVTRGANHRVEVRGNQLWSAPLEEMIIHTLAFDLANRLPQGAVILPGQAKPLGPMRSLYVTFSDLASGTDNVFVLDARWRITQPGTADIAGQERITVPLTSAESTAIAEGMSHALGQFADRVVMRLR
jgi:uncharacterized lipoprotein YmbA